MYWNKDEDRYLMQNYQKQSIDELCIALNRTKHSVRWRLHYLGLVNVKRWTSKEIEYLKNNYAKTKNDDLAKKLRRTRLAIVDKACKLGLEKDEAFLYELHKRPNTGQFDKGYKTWNKGMKFENPPFCSSWFKKGHQTWNKMPDDLRELVVTLRRLKRKLNGKRLQ